MRLSRLKLAGFKSFVDPTVLKLPSDLVGIVGPNGCGKSNTIDAVRWVMGERSAKYLRGESMEDVIFTGSSARAPVGQASVELVFDNREGRLGGQYAAYDELSVKRQVGRDGQSQYFLNGGRCRRRDIQDIFLGTGLGPRSYAIIQQGMVSRLIEAKPEELRVYLEEAAGISKYKERRRETELRIRHTRDNLERLNDLREEVEKQLAHLKRQARTAERYREYKAEERLLSTQVLALRWREHKDELDRRQAASAEVEAELAAALARQREAEAGIETERARLGEHQEAFNAEQATFYQLGAEVSRLEQAIAHRRQLRERREREIAQAEQARGEARAHVEHDRQRLAQLQAELSEHEPQLARASAEREGAAAALAEAEQAVAALREQSDDFNRRRGEAARQLQLEQTRAANAERNAAQWRERAARLGEERDGVDLAAEREALVAARADERARAAAAAAAETALQAGREAVLGAREQLRADGEALDQRRGELQRGRGRLASLEALQQAAMRDCAAAGEQWLRGQGLAAAPRLGESLRVAAGWERAVEAVLGDRFDAAAVAQLSEAAAPLAELVSGSVGLWASGGAAAAVGDALCARVEGPAVVAQLLHGARAVEDLASALQRRAELRPGEYFVSRAGERVGPDWVACARGEDAGDGVLARERDIETLRNTLAQSERIEAELAAAREARRAALASAEGERESAQAAANAAAADHARVAAEARALVERLARVEQRAERVDEEIAEASALLEREVQALSTAAAGAARAERQLAQLGEEGGALAARQAQWADRLRAERERAQAHTEASQLATIRVETLRSQRAASAENLERMSAQLQHLEQRHEQLLLALDEDGDGGDEEARERLAALLERRTGQERRLAAAREAVAAIELAVRNGEQRRAEGERDALAVRERLNQQRLACHELKVRVQTVVEQLAELEAEAQAVLGAVPPAATLAAWNAQLEAVQARIQRLGAINLAAIDEYRAAGERDQYLRQQIDDVSEALATLEAAIATIDRETRARFKATYDRVNAQLQVYFPRLFGGGQAELQLTENDLLNAGVQILARPPGKRVSSIHLLSGGEKALSAVALVFAFFDLNPAPFCMLDEVDAPLDDANVGRFCELVKEMSKRVQFIFITHNKQTMELAEQLMGVTMNEPGVSRLVSVDVAEAAQMVTA